MTDVGKNVLVTVIAVTKDRKKDIIECIDAYLKSTYKKLEIIVVDNASEPPIKNWFKKRYPKVKLIERSTNVGAAEGRNIGIEASKGDYLVFTDDDAYPAKDMVEQIVNVFKKNKDAGIVQPLIYDKQNKNLLQGAGHDIDLLTGRIKAWGVREVDRGQYDGLREVPLCGCVWVVKREVITKIGNYDEDYFIPYEDSDFSIRAKLAGYKNYCYSPAKSWHQGPKKTFVHPWVEWLGITSKERAFRVARNKMIFMKKHSPYPNKIIFFFLIFPVYLFLHSLIIIAAKKFNILNGYWGGVFSGIKYIIQKG